MIEYKRCILKSQELKLDLLKAERQHQNNRNIYISIHF